METNKYRISVKRSNRSIVAQVIDDSIGKTVVCVSSHNVSVKNKKKQTIDAAKDLASKIKSNKIKSLFYSTGAKLYSGRIKIFAEVLRENGIDI